MTRRAETSRTRARHAWTLLVVALAASLPSGCGSDVVDTRVPNPDVHRISVDGCGLTPEIAVGVSSPAVPGLVVTVAHSLAGNGPVLVDGRPATLLALDTRADVALLATTESGPDSTPDPTPDSTPDSNGGWLRAPRAGERIQVATIDGTDVVSRPVDIARVAPIRFRDEVAGTVVERAGAVIPLTIRGGDSGAPLIGADGRMVAMLFAGSREANRSYAVSSTEIASLLDDLHGDRASAIRPDC